MPPFAPLLTPFHTDCLGLSFGDREYRWGRREAERSSQSHEGKDLSARDHVRLVDGVHVKNLLDWMKPHPANASPTSRHTLIHINGGPAHNRAAADIRQARKAWMPGQARA